MLVQSSSAKKKINKIILIESIKKFNNFKSQI